MNDNAQPVRSMTLEVALAQMLAKCFQVPRQVQDVSTDVTGLGKLLNAILARLEGVDRRIGEIAQMTEGLNRRQECLDRASREIQTLTEQHYEAHVIVPLTRQLLPLIDLIQDLSSSPEEGAANGDGNGNGHSDHSVLKALQAQILDLLASYGIEPMGTSEMEPFDPRTMFPMDFATTNDPSLDRMVAKTFRA